MFLCRRSFDDDEIGTTPPQDYPLMDQPIKDAAFIPLRLTMSERKVQRLMRAVILASSYTDKVDNEALANKPKRAGVIGREINNALSGLVIGIDLQKGAKLLAEKKFTPFEDDIVGAIEYCRRYKIMNPDLLRTDYVKFLYMVQDAVSTNAVETLGFSVAAPVVTVRRYLEAINCTALLEDKRLPLCITPVPKHASKTTLNQMLRFKDVTVNRMVKEYAAKAGCSADEVEIAIRSLNDANCFSNDNVLSSAQMLELLRQHFSPEPPASSSVDLSIREGHEGSRLTHEHAKQFTFVLQSLTLWKNICRRMFQLWVTAEEDLLNPAVPYELRSTGQGLQRVQAAPKLYAAVSAILDETKRELGQWVGSDKIHLGDNQVPNAFNFIDKYGQISRIVVPILRTIARVDELEKDKHAAMYLREVWGSAANAKVAILADFFRHGFDGSGGDNMEDAGSCIDGRLTSAWNWCNCIRTKPFYPLFLMAGFSSFDGDLSL